jgi:ubiquinone/menaquinone biosynthesis C-methylase UbiE
MYTSNADNTRRFSGRASDYAQGRPGYPRAALDRLLSFTAGTYADIGAGTGKLSELLAPQAEFLYAVEPNDDMRACLTESLSRYKNTAITSGTAEHTLLPDHVCDAVVCAQAFHWFDTELFRAECDRLLKPGGRVFILYNWSEKPDNHFDLTEKYSSKDKHPMFSKSRDEAISEFFGGNVVSEQFKNPVAFDQADFVAYMSSHSNMPSVGEPLYQDYVADLNAYFTEYAVDNKLTVRFVTNIFYQGE